MCHADKQTIRFKLGMSTLVEADDGAHICSCFQGANTIVVVPSSSTIDDIDEIDNADDPPPEQCHPHDGTCTASQDHDAEVRIALKRFMIYS
jgi:hypothetical protein